MTLGEFLQQEMASKAPWNCSTFPADWCATLGHPDFAWEWRGFTDTAECEAASAAGLAGMWTAAIGDRMPAVSEYQAGDVGVIKRAGLEAGAIFTGERWAVKGERGISFFNLPSDAVAKAWRP